MPFGMAVNTPRISTGNVRTTYDPIVAAVTAAGGGVVPGYVSQNLPQPFGTTFMDIGGSDSVSGTTTQLPVGQVAVYKYVLYKSTTNPAVVALPGVVYYTDNTGLIVSGSPTDGVIGSVTAAAGMDGAGIMMVNSGDLTTLTATLLNNGTAGSGVWICIGGFCKAVASVTGGVAGDKLYGNTQTSGTAFTIAHIANATAYLATSRQLGYAITSNATVNAAAACDAIITLTGLAPY
jgi:hypothetical protein